MRAVIQRVREAKVTIANECTGAIGPGFLVLAGFGQGDTAEVAGRMADKIIRLRIFADEAGKTNKSLLDTGNSVLVVSQFTLYANCRRGNRPSFTEALEPVQAASLYGRFVACFRERLGADRVQTGVFGADMQVALVNDGPFTIVLDSEDFA